MQKFKKKYLGVLVLSYVASIASAQSVSSISPYNVAMSGDDGQGSVHPTPTYEQPVSDEPVYEEAYAQDVAVEGCCSNVGGILSSVLQAGLFLTGIINDKDNNRSLAKLTDMIKPDGYYAGFEIFADAIQPRFPSVRSLVSLAPFSAISKLPASVVPPTIVSSSEALSSLLPSLSTIPSSIGVSVSGPLSTLSGLSALAPLAPLASISSIVPSSASIPSAVSAFSFSVPASSLLPSVLPLIFSSILLPSSLPLSLSGVSPLLTSVPQSASSVLSSFSETFSIVSSLANSFSATVSSLSSSILGIPSVISTSIGLPSTISAIILGSPISSSILTSSSAITNLSLSSLSSVLPSSAPFVSSSAVVSSSLGLSSLVSSPVLSSLSTMPSSLGISTLSSSLVSAAPLLSGSVTSTLASISSFSAPSSSLSSIISSVLGSSGLSSSSLLIPSATSSLLIGSSSLLPSSGLAISSISSSLLFLSSFLPGMVSLVSGVSSLSGAVLSSLAPLSGPVLASSSFSSSSVGPILGVAMITSSILSLPFASSSLTLSSIPSNIITSSLIPSSSMNSALSGLSLSSAVPSSSTIVGSISALPLSSSASSSGVLSSTSVSSIVPLAVSVSSSLSSGLVPVASLVSGLISSTSSVSGLPLSLSTLLSSIPVSLSSLPTSISSSVLSVSSAPSFLSSTMLASSSVLSSSLVPISSLFPLSLLVPASLSSSVAFSSLSVGSSSLLSTPILSVSSSSFLVSSLPLIVSAIPSLVLGSSSGPLSSLPSSLSVSSLVPAMSSQSSSFTSSSLGVSTLSLSVPLFVSASVSSSSLPLSSVPSSLAASSIPSSLLSVPSAIPALSSSAVSSIPSSSASSLSSLPLSSLVPAVITSLLSSSSFVNVLSSSSGPSLSLSSTVSQALSSIPSSGAGVSSSVLGSSSSLSGIPSLPSAVSMLSSSVPAFSLSTSASVNSLISTTSALFSLSSPVLSLSSIPASISGPFLSSSTLPSLSSLPFNSLSSLSSSVPATSALSSGVPALSSGLPSSSSFVPSMSLGPLSVASSYVPIISGAGGALSWRVSNPNSRISWKYGFHDYNYDAKYEDFEFKNLVVFGDSLSDTGSFGRGSVYVADGNPYVIYNSYLSLALTGKVVTPERFGGANYAMSGAVLRNDLFDPMSWIIRRDSLKSQVNRYLERNGGANKDDIFILWGGGNDVTADIQYAVMNPVNWGTVFNSVMPNQPYLNDKALYPGLLAQKLIDNGAQGPILILNLPSSAYTSFTGVMLEGLMDIGMITGGTPLDIFNIGGWLMKSQDSFLRDPANRVGNLADGKGIEYFRENNINAIHSRYPFIPRSLVAAYFDTVFKAQNNVISWFNQSVNGRIEQVVGGNVVQLDVDGLFREVMDNPLAYGIDEILVPECTIGQVAPNCDEGDRYYHGHDGRHYMYTDWHHPSAEMHRIIAEYAIATVNAPAYMTGLSRSLEIGAKARQDYLLSELTRINARPYEGQGQSYVFGGFSGGYSKQNRSLNNRAIVYNGLNIGYGFRPAEGVDVGLMGSLGISKMKPHQNLKYDQKDLVITGFAQYSTGSWWINGLISGGTTKFDSIGRSIPLGENARVEKSKTDGKTWGGRIETGYEFLLGNTWVLAPVLAYTSYRYEVGAFDENGISSTAMRFKKQKRNQEYATLGVRISDDCPDDSAFMRASIDITANRNLNDDKKNKLIGEGGLKRYNTTFSREANRLVKNAKSWFEIKPTVQFKLDKNSRITTSVNYALDKNKSKSKNLSYSVGYRYEL
ncbi:MAG: autotransporter domain-containing protein [Neisseriaceae bacterium]|nr:MAG: autotransporter domain-containing protein [Neisseriaceae bacterium]